jgi:hypothetical protein
MATHNSTLETAVARASRHGFTVQTKGKEGCCYQLVGPACTPQGLGEIVDLIDRGSSGSGQSLEARRSRTELLQPTSA